MQNHFLPEPEVHNLKTTQPQTVVTSGQPTALYACGECLLFQLGITAGCRFKGLPIFLKSILLRNV